MADEQAPRPSEEFITPTGTPSGHSSDNPSTAFAPRTCVRCKRRKRKCDKKLPKCSRCERLLIDCVYEPGHEGGSSMGGITQPMTIWPPLGEFDSDNMPTPPFNVLSMISLVSSTSQLKNSIVSQVFTLLRERNVNIRQSIETYFETIECWMSIVQRERFYAQLSRFQEHPESPTFAVLLLSMNLFIQDLDAVRTETGDFCTIYNQTKALVMLLQSSSSEPCIELVQSCLIISMFEFSHGESKRAYLTVEIAISMARCIDLHNHPTARKYDDIQDYYEAEERSHVWWSLFITERMICSAMLDPTLPRAMPTPSPDHLMPLGTTMWDPQANAWRTTFEQYPLSTSPNVRFRPFRRTAQGAVILGRVLDLANETARTGCPPPASAVIELDEEIQSHLMIHMEQNEDWERYCESIAALVSGLMILYVPYLCDNPNPIFNPHPLSPQSPFPIAPRPRSTLSSPPQTPPSHRAAAGVRSSATYSSSASSARSASSNSDIARAIDDDTKTLRARAYVACRVTANMSTDIAAAFDPRTGHDSWIRRIAPFAGVAAMQAVVTRIWLVVNEGAEVPDVGICGGGGSRDPHTDERTAIMLNVLRAFARRWGLPRKHVEEIDRVLNELAPR
ncbi:fungal-specific transcription factor domain-containing protein [Lineolata rhizophorae]|uniref:Fungal-specific transcription factor domain-containing protein n=1 Tax=Lineolata rhizophorae TaxID=578093 RepID=A0A6A6NUG1_9PEZI|nr:fungal-specific transcription factor domain-containing protein [Lineolata rhizophorae]